MVADMTITRIPADALPWHRTHLVAVPAAARSRAITVTIATG
jgi:hypothetical protein